MKPQEREKTSLMGPCRKPIVPKTGERAAARAGSCPMRQPLLLGLWVAEVPVRAKPSHMTSAQGFETQHMQPRPQGCNTAMGNVNKSTTHCKGPSTFLHESFSRVATTCQTPTVACKNAQENCHLGQGVQTAV
ncbi:ribonuclease 7-like [Ailuropoda melanoleuca]|uniref:ribonuclease 7-like n=1 Tax=Ailuropoda melanoleuca TaxID=9646 RepID=UPI001494EDC1|nr:ribonuclease 7-like [Ailuropoda melanoleuca]